MTSVLVVLPVLQRYSSSALAVAAVPYSLSLL